MTKSKRIVICLLLALIFEFPYRWIQYKGTQMVSIVDVYNLGMRDLFFDFSLLLFDTLILFIIWIGILKFILSIRKFAGSHE